MLGCVGAQEPKAAVEAYTKTGWAYLCAIHAPRTCLPNTDIESIAPHFAKEAKTLLDMGSYRVRAYRIICCDRRKQYLTFTCILSSRNISNQNPRPSRDGNGYS